MLLTIIDCVVCPVDQTFPAALFEVNVTLPPEQNVRGPLAVITGCGALVDAFTVTEEEVAIVPALLTFTA